MKRTEKILIQEMRDHKINVRNSTSIFNQKKLSSLEVSIILKWLPDVLAEDLGSGDCLVRSLIAAQEPYDSSTLQNLFENPDFNEVIKWGIANTLVNSKTNDISLWLKSQLLNGEYRYEKGALVPGLLNKGGFKTREEVNHFLKLIFDKYPYHVLKMFIKTATEIEINFLKEGTKEMDEKLKKEVEKVIAIYEKKR